MLSVSLETALALSRVMPILLSSWAFRVWSPGRLWKGRTTSVPLVEAAPIRHRRDV